MKAPDLDNLDPEEKKRLIKKSQMASVKTSTSETLAAHVVLYRSLNMNKDIAIACMEELMKRKKNGDDFDFETHIDNEVAKVPKPKNADYAKIIRDMQRNFDSNTKKGI
tara:strand:+ start:14 stop:340 length:327 start_codon:yes stop_codon:yes gene_type:complete